MTDNFNGNNHQLVASICALIDLDSSGALVPHGLGGHARELLTAAASRLAQAVPPVSEAEPVAEVCDGYITVPMPDGLHPDTQKLVAQFAFATATKLRKAERKYGYSDGWKSSDWMDECRTKLLEHLAKGDPRDVANYCAFLWWHNESTAAPPVTATPSTFIPWGGIGYTEQAATPSPSDLTAYGEKVREAVGKMLEKKADDFALENGYSDMGSVSFGRGAHAEAKHEYHSTLLELAEEIRSMPLPAQSEGEEK